MKKKLTVLALRIFSLTCLVSGTMMFFVADDYATNVVTTGKIDIRLIEEHIDENGEKVPFPQEGVGGVMPGMRVSKIVTVQNIGRPAYIRVKVEKEILNKDGEKLPDTVLMDDVPVELIKVDYDAEHWLQDRDYFYYKTDVKTGEITKALFEEVLFAGEMDNVYANCTINVIVQAEAVQSANNPIPAGGIARVGGWQ